MSNLNNISQRYGVSMRKMAYSIDRRDTEIIKRNLVKIVRMYDSHPELLNILVEGCM